MLNSENLIENIAALFDSDRGMIFESNNVFTNWIFDICMKRKKLNKQLQGDDNENEETEGKKINDNEEVKNDVNESTELPTNPVVDKQSFVEK